MKLSYDLTLEQSQKLIMTPELRQAIELLQFNSLELKDYIANELEANPMLESVEPVMETFDIEKYEKEPEVDWKEYFEKYDDNSYKVQYDRNTEEYNYESFITDEPTLYEYLMEQLGTIKLSERQYNIGQVLILSLDENGYLLRDLSDIGEEWKFEIEELDHVLSEIQKFEPIGVGARDLKECLLIQLRDRNDAEEFVVDIIEGHLEDLSYNRIQKISKDLNISIDKVEEGLDYIRTLVPRPGSSISNDCLETKYVSPDAEIKLVDGKYEVIINDVTGPRLNINNHYRDLLTTGNDEKVVEFLNEKLNRAMWVIRSIEQRRSTIRKVIESILKFQLEFFEEGERALKPLTLKEVAADIDMHESTISRATSGKYVQTPRGLFELKYFFSSGYLGSEGDISSTSIKSMIKSLVEEEDTKKPYSDQKIADILNTKGIDISRRTVAKYRTELNILSSSMRRRY